MIRKIAILIIGAATLQACAATDRLSYVGQTPPMTPIENPAVLAGAGPQQIPMPPVYATPRQHTSQTNSLWNANSPTFFGDPRAARVGDIVTVNIDISDRAQLQNSTNRTRSSAEDADLTQFFGADLTGFFNDNIDPSSLASLGSSSSSQGAGSVNRTESISLTVAALVTSVLPNGNLVIAGRQEVRVNNEVRELLITGIARPQDIASDNTIAHTQIAEARISYGGRGHLTDVQRPRYGQEIYDLLMPF
ncbi:flagellar basal body L-ring protein FlgH [Maricaulis sp.]|uniref:flagellar basal body L-ring protein FlgH n=1 Tax=Maricaulis sp. TaxID=1486257 RepID=UPI001B28ECA9|nr:flagellar basal body L-ring protein FlgH [Maricaulis sp.]MBO6765312.1 flagellar basal body L-ring protein FlgH [Maricaulis sp.]